ncbi:MAG: hypothetical protein ACTSWY_10070 [Promethearchaeota archaeon]
MPLRITWFKSKYLGIVLFYLGIMGLSQSLIVFLAQYMLLVGSIYILVLLPVGVSVTLTYCAQILFENNSQSRSSRKYKNRPKTILEKKVWEPIIITLLSFIIIFLIGFSVSGNLGILYSFIIAENAGAIGTLILVSILENRNKY